MFIFECDGLIQGIYHYDARDEHWQFLNREAPQIAGDYGIWVDVISIYQ